jgi:hypothetical protein
VELQEKLINRKNETTGKILRENKISSLIGQEEHGNLYVKSERIKALEQYILGHAVVQAVSCWLPAAASRVRVRAACRDCGEQSSIGAGFLRVLPFPMPIIIPPISPST